MKNRQAVFLGVVQCGAERQKPPQAGSTESLMFPAKGKELFYHKGCKFAYVGVDQTRRRPLRGASTPWFPLFIAGALQLRKLRRFACKPELKDDM